MERVEIDATPAEEWISTLNATCNRLTTQYMNLIRSASSVTALDDEEQASTNNATGTNSNNNNNNNATGGGSGSNRHDPRAGGGHMISMNDPPPPPLASDILFSTLQCELASENICVAISNILSLIRTLKLSLLLMDDITIEAEEEIQVYQTTNETVHSIQHCIELEQKYLHELRKSLDNN